MSEIAVFFKDKWVLSFWVFPIVLIILFSIRIWKEYPGKKGKSLKNYRFLLLILIVCLIAIGFFFWKGGEEKSKNTGLEFARNIDSIPVIPAQLWTKIMFKKIGYLDQIATNRGFSKNTIESFLEDDWIRFDFANPEWKEGDNLQPQNLEEIFVKNEMIDTAFYCLSSKESYYNFFSDLEHLNVAKQLRDENNSEEYYFYGRCFFIRRGYKSGYGNIIAIVTE